MALARLRLLKRRPGLRSGSAQFFGFDKLDERLVQYVRRGRGTFVELGAFDGVTQSNTAWLEANRGWRGILIEAIPEAYEQCVRNRPLAKVVNCACVSSDYPQPTVDMVYSGLMSIVRGARTSDLDDDAWVSLGERLQEVERYTCTVPARTLTCVLDSWKLRTFDLLSLDVEGYELEVLKGFDLERFGPRNILVEDSGAGDDVAQFLTRHEYRMVAELGRGDFTRDVLYERAKESSTKETVRRWIDRSSFLLRALPRRVIGPHWRGGTNRRGSATTRR